MDMLGVVKLKPVPTNVPPDVASYQSTVSPEPTFAIKVTVPVPHRVNGPGPAVGASGPDEMVAVIAVLVVETQVEVVLLASA